MTRAIAALAMAVAVAAPAFARAQGQALPRTPDGKPDFSGIWQAVNTAYVDIEDHAAEPGEPAGTGVVVGGEIPYQPWAIEQKKKNYADRATEDTDAKCYLPGVPRITYMPYPFRIIQTPARIDISYEYVGALRHIFTNGAPHPSGHIDWWMGDSRGHWEGDTLVVDVIHFNDQTRFDKAGNFQRYSMHAGNGACRCFISRSTSLMGASPLPHSGVLASLRSSARRNRSLRCRLAMRSKC